jgi:HAD superfamily hydrolase (TIGR01549 family)
MGIISNFDPRLDVLLRNMKINHYFDFVLSSYDCGFEKPDKRIFDKAIEASEIKDLDPKECLHIGDTPITDYIGAKKARTYLVLICLNSSFSISYRPVGIHCCCTKNIQND